MYYMYTPILVHCLDKSILIRNYLNYYRYFVNKTKSKINVLNKLVKLDKIVSFLFDKFTGAILVYVPNERSGPTNTLIYYSRNS